jgi:hypothetical protein
MSISVYSAEAWLCICLVVRWMCSALVEHGLLRFFARTSMQMVADLTRCLSRLMMVISDSAKRLLTPSEFVDVPLGPDRFYTHAMDEIEMVDRQAYTRSFWKRELLQTVMEFARFYADLLKITADIAQHLLKMMDDPRTKCWLHAGAFVCQMGSTLLLYHLAWTYLWILLSKCLRCVTVCAMVDSVLVCQ